MKTAATLLACLLFAGPALAEPTEADRERALELFREGNESFSRGDLHAAYEAYQEAWSLHQSFDVACNLGRTEAELELSVPAAEHLDYCLRTFATSGKLGLREAERKFKDLFDKVRAKVGALRIASRPVDAEVLIDGASMGTGPIERLLFMAPGERRVVVRARGYRDRVEVLSVTPGSSHTLDARLEPEPAPAAAATGSGKLPPGSSAEATAAPSYQRPHGMEPRTIAVISGASLTLVGLGLGVAFTLDAQGAADESDRLRAQAFEAGCAPGSSSALCADHRESIDHEKRSRSIANIAFAASGVIGAATVGLWLVLPERAAERVVASGVRPWLTAGSGGVAFAGSY